MSRYVAVVDTSVLITLEAVGLLEHMDQLFHAIHVPAAVRAEFLAEEERLLSKSGAALRTIFDRAPFRACDAFDPVSLELLRGILDPGEAEAIEQRQQLGTGFVLIDERRGRQVAQERMIEVRGAARIIAQLHLAGFCANYSAAIQDARSKGIRISARVEADALEAAKRTGW